GQTRRPQAGSRCPPCIEWCAVCSECRLPVAGAAKGLAAEKHGASLSAAMGLRWDAVAHPRYTLCGLQRASRTRSKPDGLRYRQPEREKCGESDCLGCQASFRFLMICQGQRLMTGFQRVADRVAIYKAFRTSVRPPAMALLPRICPESTIDRCDT